MNIIGSLDCETGGLDPLTCSMLSFSLVPMTQDFKIIQDIPILKLTMYEPSLAVEPDALRINKLFNYQKHDNYKVAFTLLLQYLSKYKITKIDPLAQELDFDFSFMNFWLGTNEMRKIFSRHKRDTRRLAYALIDAGLYRGTTKLIDLCHDFEIENPNPHESTNDALMCALLYPKMVERLKTGTKTCC